MIRMSMSIAGLLIAALLTAPSPLNAAWVADGIAVCSANDTQDEPQIISDGSGGAIIVWRDNRTLNTNIYAQRVDASGNILWLSDAMPVCTAINSQSVPLIVPDGAGGAIIAWQDFRSGNVLEIYAQKLNSSGYIQWNSNSVAICTGKTGLVLGQMIADGAGGAIITWYDRRLATNDIFAQKIDGSGAVQWTANGVNICTASLSQMNPTLASDGAGGAIITWQDKRSDPNDIYAQRVNSSGAVQWTADGIIACNAGQSQTYPQIVPDGSGGAIIAWADHRNTLDDDIYAQRVDANGNTLWTAGGVAISATTRDQTSCRIVSGGSGQSIIIWVDSRGTDSDIYAQKVDANGTALWAANGVPVCTATGNQVNCQIIANGPGGAIATWEDNRAATTDVYIQKIEASGGGGWTANGVALCTATGNQTTPQLASDGVGGAITPWKDDRVTGADIYAQRVDAAGHTVVATLLQNFSASLSGPGIEIDWTLSEIGSDVEFFVLRSSDPLGTFSEIPSPDIRRDGLSFSFIDKNREPGSAFQYRVDVCDGGERKTLFETGPIKTPAMPVTLYQNHPNPFNPSTSIRYYVPERCNVSLEVYDARGNLVRRLDAGLREKGSYTVDWNGIDGRGNRASSGVYLYRLKAGKEMLSRKLILLR